MSAPDLSLLAKRRFGPVFLVMFLGAFNDNLLKFALLFLASFSLYIDEPAKAGILATVATGLFILPYFLFSAVAGQCADAWDKARMIRVIKGAEVVIMTVALTGFWIESVALLLGALFLLGVHSAFFGPIKYAILPQHLRPGEIMGGTGLVEAGTFLAILGGQLLAGVTPPREAGWIAFALAFSGLLASLAIPPAPALAPDLKIETNIFRSSWRILKVARHGPGVWPSILGISWFFSLGAVLLAELAPLVKATLGARQEVATLFLLIFSVSVALGSMLVNRILGGRVSARYVPLAALALAAFLMDLWLASSAFVIITPNASIAGFLETPGSWRIVVDLAGIAMAGGMFIVPLYAILQTHSPPRERSRTVAANNVVNAAMVVLLVAAVTAMLSLGVSVPDLLAVLGGATLLVAGIAYWLFPESRDLSLLRRLRRAYRTRRSANPETNPPSER